MTEHPSLTSSQSPLQEMEKSLKEKLVAVAENAVNEYLKEYSKRLSEVDAELLNKLNELSAKLDLKQSNLELEREALTCILAELNK